MINFNQNQDQDLEVVDGNFQISSGSNDPTAFFNMPPPNQYQNSFHNQNFQTNFRTPNGFSNMNQFNGFSYHSSQGNQDTIVTPNVVQPDAQPSANCNGNCNVCVWSFLCNKAAGKLSSISGLTPKLS